MQVEFEFRDDATHGKWVRRQCDVRDLAQAEEIYGLADVEHRWLSVDGKPVQDPSPAEPVDWGDVLAAYEAYMRSASDSYLGWSGWQPASLREFLGVEYESWRENGCFAGRYPAGWGAELRRSADRVAADISRRHVEDMRAAGLAGEGLMQDLAAAYASYACRAYEHDMPLHGWSAPNVKEFCLGDYELWLNTPEEGPSPYSEMFGAMQAAYEEVSDELFAAVAVRGDRSLADPETDRGAAVEEL